MTISTARTTMTLMTAWLLAQAVVPSAARAEFPYELEDGKETAVLGSTAAIFGLGLWTVRWLRDSPGVSAELDGRVRLGGIETEPAGPRVRRLRAAGERKPKPSSFGVVQLFDDDSPGVVLELIAGFLDGEESPAVVGSCLTGDSERLGRIERVLSQRDEYETLRCPESPYP